MILAIQRIRRRTLTACIASTEDTQLVAGGRKDRSAARLHGFWAAGSNFSSKIILARRFSKAIHRCHGLPGTPCLEPVQASQAVRRRRCHSVLPPEIHALQVHEGVSRRRVRRTHGAAELYLPRGGCGKCLLRRAHWPQFLAPSPHGALLFIYSLRTSLKDWCAAGNVEYDPSTDRGVRDPRLRQKMARAFEWPVSAKKSELPALFSRSRLENSEVGTDFWDHLNDGSLGKDCSQVFQSASS